MGERRILATGIDDADQGPFGSSADNRRCPAKLHFASVVEHTATYRLARFSAEGMSKIFSFEEGRCP